MRDRVWLGTALWGWGIERDEGHALLDRFVDRGGRWIDAATNYPINGRAADFGAANRIAAEWLRANPDSGVRVFCKVGALDNSGAPRQNLDESALAVTAELLRGQFGEALGGIGLHWDDRDDPARIAETLDAMRNLAAEGLAIGLSGVRHPEIHARIAPDLAGLWWVQVKDNMATHAAYDHYAPHLPDVRYLAYGINMGGVKSAPVDGYESSLSLRGLSEPPVAEKLRATLRAGLTELAPFPQTLADLSLIRVAADRRLYGCILGPRTVAQLDASLGCWRRAMAAHSDDLAHILAMLSDAAGAARP